jgi:hypothetical protein
MIREFNNELVIPQIQTPPQEIVTRSQDFYKFSIGDPRMVIRVVLPVFVGLGFIWFGLTTTGSYYEPASRFGGILADIWYSWQLGTLMAIVGSIAIYDAIRKSGYL